MFFFFFSSRRRHTRSLCDWSSDVCSSDLKLAFSSAGEIMISVAIKLRSTRLRTRFGSALIGRLGRTLIPSQGIVTPGLGGRSEERRVGKECRSRGSRQGQEENADSLTAER